MKKLLILFLILFSIPAFSAEDRGASSDKKDYGQVDASKLDTASTDINMKSDLDQFGSSVTSNFQNNKILPDFVPVEASIGYALIYGLSKVVNIIYKNFIPFLNVFIVAILTFWILMETWQMMRSKENDYWDLVMRIVRVTTLSGIWIWVINNNPSEIFMWLIAPIISLGGMVADTILNSATNLLYGVNILDTCSAIHKMVQNGDPLFISNDYASSILCLSTKTTGFLYLGMVSGFNLMGVGIGNAIGLFVVGLVIIPVFLFNIFKFFFRGISIIIDLFFIILTLPFTAMKECFGSMSIKYDGMFKPVFEAFVGLFNAAPLSKQFTKFIEITIYFIIFAIISALAVTLLAGVNLTTGGDPFAILITGFVVAYLVDQVDVISGKIVSNINDAFQYEGSIKGFVNGVINDIKDKVKSKLVKKTLGGK